MDFVLENASITSPAAADVDRAIASRRRRERFRDSRRDPLPEELSTPHPEHSLMARNTLAVVRRQVGEANWNVLMAIGSGHSFKTIADSLDATEGAVRVKVMRLRRAISEAA